MQDVTIIGAGPAGSAAALMLSRRDWAVTLIEQHRFPRDKVCGECLSEVGIDVLGRLGLGEILRAAGAIPLTQAILHNANGESAATLLPRPMLGLSRHVLDALLLDAAHKAGVHVRQPARCEELAVNDHGVAVTIRDLQNNHVETLIASFAILADGKGALPGPTPPITKDIGIKSHWTGVAGPRDAIELFGCAGCYGGLAPIEGGRWNAAFSVPAERVRKHRGDLESLFAELMKENKSLARRLKNANRGGPWLASPLPRFAVRSKWLPRVIPIGNAAASLEPIGGEGMGVALRSAELASEAIDDARGLWDAPRQRGLRRAYENLWRMRRFTCRAAAMAVSSATTADLALEWMKIEPLSALAMRSLGKGASVS